MQLVFKSDTPVIRFYDMPDAIETIKICIRASAISNRPH